MSKVLVVTNDFPPRPGGIQTFVHQLLLQLDPSKVVVYTSRWRDWADFDKEQPFPIVREDTSVLLPTRRVRRRAAALLRHHECTSVLFGAAAPLGLMGDDLRRAGAQRVIALTHGHEAGWAQLPIGRQTLRRIGEQVDVVTYLGEYTRRRIAGALSPEAAARMTQLTPGVDAELFNPEVDGTAVRDRYRLTDRPVVVCVSRLMARKGQDRLIEALPAIRRRVPGAALLFVGGGPYRKRLQRLAEASGHASDIVFTGSVPWADLPAHFAAGDVFAMPCRTRRRGLDVEGLGIVYLEASATGLPVVAGRAGGAPDAVEEGRTGLLVSEARGGGEVAHAVAELLADQELARRMGQTGREWVLDEWTWPTRGAQLAALLRTR